MYQAVELLCHLPLNLHVQQNAHQVNWDLVAEVVNGVSRTYRSIKQCRARYENTIIPREEGKLLYDVSPRKHKKQKTSYKVRTGPFKVKLFFGFNPVRGRFVGVGVN
jgi:E1A-binding protein p400